MEAETAQACAAVAAELERAGWAVQPDFLPADEVAALADEVLAYWAQGEFRPAGVGHGAELRLRTDVRQDHVHWLVPEDATPAQRRYLARMETLRRTLNERLLLGLFEFEGHFALYPPGAFYRTHLDQFRGVEERLVSCVVYLNRDWRPADGGGLRLYLEAPDRTPYVDVEPRAGTLACFLSGQFYHEVRPTAAPRLSLTGWFRRRLL
ncbi:2OG-Fe(II) oxygenase [Ectothiorhodospiraceae bacterium 2226]|nr:2OG-Fe(II) oxygenase [Ectothiorhodospiraceae bacterium 2226]